MTELTRTEAELADDIDLDELDQGGGDIVQELKDISLMRLRGALTLHVAWEPLSFKQEWDRATYPFIIPPSQDGSFKGIPREDDFSHDFYRAASEDGRLFGETTDFGQVKKSFEDVTGIRLTKNEVFRPALIGRKFVTHRERRDWVDKDGNPVLNRNTGQPGYSYYTVVVDEAPDYEVPENRRTVRYPRQQQGGAASNGNGATPEPTSEQIAALKTALNGKAESEYVDVVLFGGNETINVEPFVSEAADPARLTERLIALGGTQVNGKIMFPSEA